MDAATFSGLDLCLEEFTGLSFYSTADKIRLAVAEVNLQILTDGFASLNTFYDHLGLSETSLGNTLGWPNKLLEISLFGGLNINAKPILVYRFIDPPIMNYSRDGN